MICCYWLILIHSIRALPICLHNVTSTLFGNILIVSTGCKEPPGEFNPPTDRYRWKRLLCDNVTNELDARETGQILRFARDYRGKITEDRIIFTHAHERSHYTLGIWKHIERAIRTKYFWDHDYGNLVVQSLLSVRFVTSPNGEIWANKGGDSFWVNMTDIVDFLFANTSLDHIYLKEPEWKSACCSTFFLDPKNLLIRTAKEYDLILRRVQYLAVRPYCSFWKPRAACNSTFPKLYGQGLPWNIHSYLLGQVFEQSWSIIFTGRGRHLFNMTFDKPDPWQP
jgi:hypothetical protein